MSNRFAELPQPSTGTVFGIPDIELTPDELLWAFRKAAGELCELRQERAADSRAIALGKVELWRRGEVG